MRREIQEKCPNCGNPVYPNQAHCLFCGYELPPLPPPAGTLNWGRKQPAKEPRDKAQLKQQGIKRKPPLLKRCSLCGKKSLLWDKHKRMYGCLNPCCQATGDTLNSLFSWRLAIGEEHGEQPAETQRKQAVEGRAWFHNEYYDPKSRTWKSPRRVITPKKVLLILFRIACLIAAGWIGYLLLTGQIGILRGIAIFLVGIGAGL